MESLVRRLLEINSHLVEIDSQRAAFLREQEQILQSLLPTLTPELYFDDQRHRIYWNGGSVRLGKKSYLFVKTIWQGKDHQAEFSELEEAVWAESMEAKMFVARRTVSALVKHTQKNLTEGAFPYEIECVKNDSNRTLEGFRLILSKGRMKL